MQQQNKFTYRMTHLLRLWRIQVFKHINNVKHHSLDIEKRIPLQGNLAAPLFCFRRAFIQCYQGQRNNVHRTNITVVVARTRHHPHGMQYSRNLNHVNTATVPMNWEVTSLAPLQTSYFHKISNFYAQSSIRSRIQQMADCIRIPSETCDATAHSSHHSMSSELPLAAPAVLAPSVLLHSDQQIIMEQGQNMPHTNRIYIKASLFLLSTIFKVTATSRRMSKNHRTPVSGSYC